MKKVIVASTNPVKLQAVQSGFEKAFPGERFSFEGVSVPSGVSDQPKSNTETLQGAKNRANNAFGAIPHADFWVGLEGGIEIVKDGDRDEMQSFAWIYVMTLEQEGKGKTGVIYLPSQVIELINQGKELGEADDIVFGKTNSKQEQGSIGLLTHNIYIRATFYEFAVVAALIPFMNPEFYLDTISQ